MSYRYVEVKEDILDIIKLKKENQAIQSRQWFCQKLGVARATVDKAIKELIGEGVLYTVKGSGTFVKSKATLGKIANWGVICPNITKDICPDLLRGIEDYTSKNQINLVFGNSDNDFAKQLQYIERFISSDIEGCILVPSIYAENNYAACKKLKEADIPFVFCNRDVEGIDNPYITTNNYQGAFLATNYLLDRGCKSIAFVAKNKYVTSTERFCGYAAALSMAGQNLNFEHVVLKEDKSVGLEKQVKAFFSTATAPDGIICFNDAIASKVYSVLNELKLMVGRDVLVVGYDDSVLATCLQPQLTTVAFRSKEIGYCAAEILHKTIKGESVLEKIKFFDPFIVSRNSCGER